DEIVVLAGSQHLRDEHPFYRCPPVDEGIHFCAIALVMGDEYLSFYPVIRHGPLPPPLTCSYCLHNPSRCRINRSCSCAVNSTTTLLTVLALPFCLAEA